MMGGGVEVKLTGTLPLPEGKGGDVRDEEPKKLTQHSGAHRPG
jgi:hypothetical protein